MPRRLSVAFVAPLLVGVLAQPRQAWGQLHWDAGFELGVMDRVTAGRDLTAPAPTFGPAAEVHAHVALVPMVRVGAYVAEDISPLRGLPAREITEAGLRAKVSPPLLSGPWRSWVFLGLGYARAYAPGHGEVAPGSTPPTEAHVPGAVGGVLDLPVGVGIGYRLRRPWQLFAELEGRVGLAFWGPLYQRAAGEPYGGQDSFAVSLSVGVSLDE
jgi:hypothetical protein